MIVAGISVLAPIDPMREQGNHTIKEVVKRILRIAFTRTLWLVDHLIPKDPSLIVLGTSHLGNTKAIYDYIQTHDCGLTAYRYDNTNADLGDDRHRIKGLQDLRFLWKMLRAKTMVSTHGMFFQHSRRKLYIETWHGVPLKGQRYTEVGLDEKSIHKNDKTWSKYIDFFIAPSKEAAYRICASCMMDPRKVFYCGQARNDVLYRQQRDIEKVRETLTLPQCKKLILYCPTYRRDDAAQLFPFSDMDYQDLGELLAEQDAVLLLRAHSNDLGQIDEKHSPRIRPVGQDAWPDVNELLPHIDLLITDYSSIYFDFLILDRPIVFVPYDLAKFERECGLVVDDYSWWTPGDKVSDYTGFKRSISQGLKGQDHYAEKRQTINNLINYYQDGDSCSKTVEMIKKQLT